MQLISLREIRKTYTLGEVEVHALQGVSLDIDHGEYVALMGPSGSGKTTLMNTLGCLDHPTSGSYRLDGEEVMEMSGDQRARLRNRKIGFVFQNFNLLARTTAAENVELPMLYSAGLRRPSGASASDACWKRSGWKSRADHHPSQLSGGQQQRVAIARALANEPPILLADEPTGNLDSRTSREVMDLFRQLNREDGITIILVTHDQEIARHARRVVVLRDGQCPLRHDRCRPCRQRPAQPRKEAARETASVLVLVAGRAGRRRGRRLPAFARLAERRRAVPHEARPPRRREAGGQFHGHRAAGAERAGGGVRFRPHRKGVRRFQRQGEEGPDPGPDRSADLPGGRGPREGGAGPRQGRPGARARPCSNRPSATSRGHAGCKRKGPSPRTTSTRASPTARPWRPRSISARRPSAVRGQSGHGPTNLDFTDIKSPVDGIVIDRKVDPGQTVAAQFQTPVMFVVAPDLEKKVYVYASVDEADIGLIRDAQNRNAAGHLHGGRLSQGQIHGQDRPGAAQSDHGLERGHLHGDRRGRQRRLKLLPGMTANLAFQIEKRQRRAGRAQRGPAIPPQARAGPPGDRAIVEGRADDDAGDGAAERARRRSPGRAAGEKPTYVWIIDGDQLAAVEIVIGLGDKSRTEIVSGDLAEGQEVVIGMQSSCERRLAAT